MKAPPFRFWIAVMIFCTTFQNYMLRSNMSVSIVAMVEKKGSNFTPPCKRGVNDTASNKTKTGSSKKFDWTENEIAQILGAYFYGYLATVIPGGILSELFGPWHVIFWTTLASTVLTGLTPLSAQLGGAVGVVVIRALIGILGGVVYPAVNVLIAKWAPPKEKGKFMAAMMGNTLGTVITFNVVGVASEDLGWEWGFYVLIIFLGLYLIAFAIMVADKPEQSRWTSQAERDHILETQEGHLSSKKKVPPYFKILLSIPFWATCAAQFGNLWGLNLLLTYAPKFMSETLGFNLKASAGLAALPYLARLFASAAFGAVGDIMRRREVMSVTKIRKFFIIFSHFCPAACFFLIRAAGCNYPGVIALLILSLGFNGAVVVSHLVTPQDMTPNFAGTVYGIMNFIGMMAAVIVPFITGALNTYYERELIAATIIYMTGAIVISVGGLIFILFGSALVQPWNEIKEPEEAK